MEPDVEANRVVRQQQFLETVSQINLSLKQLIDNQNKLMQEQYRDNAMAPRVENMERELQQIRQHFEHLKARHEKEEYDQNAAENEIRNLRNTVQALEGRIRNLESKVR